MSATRSLCAVVPAAGRGSRLGVDVPKVFVPILPGVTIWDAVQNKLSQIANRIVLILSPEGIRYAQAGNFLPGNFAGTELATQETPRGMGDAIFGAADSWRDFDDILVVWGDQFNLSIETLRACIQLHATGTGPSLTLPVVRMPQPYVEYVFDDIGHLTQIKQSREGDTCSPSGFSDVGVFLLTGGAPLIEEWTRYQSRGITGNKTGEINFLPFLVHLSGSGWTVHRHETQDPAEAVGINTPADLEFARQLLLHKKS